MTQTCAQGAARRTAGSHVRVAPPDSAAEREADRMADTVRHGGSVSAEAKQSAEAIYRQGADGSAGAPAIGESAGGTAAAAMTGSGVPMPAALRSYFEPRFGEDFGAVRLHTGPGAAGAANDLQARAFTLGDRIAFAPGEYDPGTQRGRHLLAHELAHVAQQRQGARAGYPGAVQMKKRESPILYVGVTKNASDEVKSIERINRDRGGVTTITTSDPQAQVTQGGTTLDLSDKSGIDAFAKALSLSSTSETKVIALLEAQSKFGRDELANVIKIYAATDADPKTARMRRMVLSGHSGGFSIVGGGGILSFQTLVELAQIFPNAARQVEHLHVSGCSTGGQSTVEDFYLKAFPEVVTIWAYVGACPTDAGAVRAQAKWEGLTERPGVKRVRNKRSVWNSGTYRGGEPEKVADAVARVDGQEALFKAYFDGTRADKDGHSGPLTDYYRLVVRVAGRGGLPAADKTRLRQRVKVALRLRFYAHVRQHFIDTHGADIKAGYDEAKVTMPDYTSLSRHDAITAIAALEAADSKGTAAMKALRLMKDGLHQLDPAIIREEWILDPAGE